MAVSRQCINAMLNTHVSTVNTVQFNANSIVTMNPPTIEPLIFYQPPPLRLISQLPPPTRPAPKTIKSSYSTHDEQKDIRLLYEISWSYRQIREYLPFHLIYDQIKYAYKPSLSTTPKKKSSRPLILS